MTTQETVRGAAGDGASPASGRAVQRQPGRSPATLTGRGGIVVLSGIGLAGGLAARWTGIEVVAGAAFLAGCVFAAARTRPADLLTLVVSPPLVFFVVTLMAEFITGLNSESLARTLAVGLVTSLAGTAPWLFAGTALALLIALRRGLLGSLRELRTRLAGSRLFEEDEDADPVRWDESPATARRLPHGEVD